ncbi:MAG: nitroreductase [Thermomicrobiales bacterium]
MARRMLVGVAIASTAAAAAVIGIERYFGPRKVDPDPSTRHDTLRAINRRITNPIMLQAARLGFSYPAVVQHRGRSSGRAYETPVAAVETPDSFIIPLPYGEGVDWRRNVQAAGGCTLRYRNRPVDLSDPRVVGRTVVAELSSPEDMQVWDRFGIDRFLMLSKDLPGAV